jgi:four helix bundle protein
MLIVEQKALEAVRVLARVLQVIRRRSRPLGDQLERSLTSVPLNVHEGLRGLHGNRVARLSDAIGSAREVVACLEVAEALGYARRDDFTAGVAVLDEVCAMSWTLAYRPRR